MTLDESLPRWLRAVELAPGSARQAAIGNAAKSVAANAGGKETLGLVKLAHGIRDEPAFASLSAAIVGLDSTFGCSIDDLETRLAAGACVAAAMEQSTHHSVTAAHAVLSAEWIGWSPLVSDLPRLASITLSGLSETARRRPDITSGSVGGNLVPSLQALAPDAQAMTHEEGQQVATALSGGLDELAMRVDRMSVDFVTRVLANEEELDLLWWAFSAQSETLDQPWSAIKKNGALALLMALEFAGKTMFLTEPPSATMILRRLLGTRADSPTPLDAAVDDFYQVGGRVESPPEGHHLLPVLSCVRECQELEGQSGWRESVARWSIDPLRSQPCVSVASQTLRELLLSRTLGS
jgi:hypothetical protein